MYYCSEYYYSFGRLSKTHMYIACHHDIILCVGYSNFQGGFQLYIEVYDVDLNADDHVDDVYIEMSLSPSSSFTSRQNFYGDHGRSRIEFSFRVQCSSNYYGSDCATYCVPRDSSSGHYTCGSRGQKICRSGWTNPSNNCRTR